LRERVLFVSRLIGEKGVFDLVDALAYVLETENAIWSSSAESRRTAILRTAPASAWTTR
jgi:hypothetical protein